MVTVVPHRGSSALWTTRRMLQRWMMWLLLLVVVVVRTVPTLWDGLTGTGIHHNGLQVGTEVRVEELLHGKPPIADGASSPPPGSTTAAINLSYGTGARAGNLTIVSRAARPLREHAIVMLVQKQHSSYEGRDSLGWLNQSLDLLAANYLFVDAAHRYQVFPNATFSDYQEWKEPAPASSEREHHYHPNLDTVDLFLFHTGDFDSDDLERIEEGILARGGAEGRRWGAGLVKLVDLSGTPYWSLPHNLKKDNATAWHAADKFSVGYRHMCRFFAIRIWDFFQAVNDQGLHGDDDAAAPQPTPRFERYRYLMRLDEDSLIRSPISYDVFRFMADHGYNYGYRMCSYELRDNKVFVPGWFDRWHSTTKNLQRSPIDEELCGFYNNFFVASLDFFRSKKVQKFLHHEIDQRGFIYRKRYGDLLVHSLAVYAFAPPATIHRFLDFTYQHLTIRDSIHDHRRGCLVWGALQAGYLDPDATATLAGVYLGREWATGEDDCYPAKMKRLRFGDLSPTYSHLHDSWRDTLSLPTIAAGRVELPGRGNLSG